MAILKHKLTRLIAVLGSIAGGTFILEAPASAQFGFGGICALFNNLIAAFPFLGPALSQISALFGCDISPG